MFQARLKLQRIQCVSKIKMKTEKEMLEALSVVLLAQVKAQGGVRVEVRSEE